MDATVTRAPRLTEKLLTEDLPELIREADAGIEYLQSRLTDTGPGALTPTLRDSFRGRLDRLTRSRDWLAGRVAAETHHRTEDSP